MTVQYLELRSPQDGSVRAEGVVFSNGKVAVSWGGAHESVVVWNSLADAKAVHIDIGGWTMAVYNPEDFTFLGLTLYGPEPKDEEAGP